MTVHRPNNVHSAVQRLNRPPSSTGRPKTTTASSTSLNVSQISSQSTSSSSGNECVKVVVRSVLELYPNPIAFFAILFSHISYVPSCASNLSRITPQGSGKSPIIPFLFPYTYSGPLYGIQSYHLLLYIPVTSPSLPNSSQLFGINP